MLSLSSHYLFLSLLIATATKTAFITAQGDGYYYLSDRELNQDDVCNEENDEVIRSDFLVTFFGSPELIKESEIALLEQSIAKTYNNIIVADAACRRGFRNVSSISLKTNLQDFATVRDNLPEREFDLIFSLQGTCRHCPDGAVLFARVNETTADVLCECEPPVQFQYVVSLSEEVDEQRSRRNLQSIFEVVDAAELLPVDCVGELTNFSASVIVELDGAESLTNQEQNLAAATFANTYNRLNGLNSETCDLQFRQIIAVSVSFDTDLGRRRLQEFDDFEFIEPDLSFRLDILARCRGCTATGTFLFDNEGFFEDFNDVMQRRLDYKLTAARDDIKSFVDLMEHRNHRRDLQSDSSPSRQDECRCPENPEFRAKSEGEFISAYNETLYFVLETGLSVFDVIEIEPVDCADSLSVFNTTAEVTLNVSTPSDQSLQLIANQFRASYNTLSQRFCDPLFRRIETVVPAVVGRRELQQEPSQELQREPSRELQQQGTSMVPSMAPSAAPIVFFRIVIRFNIGGLCRGCAANTVLFNDATRRRRSLGNVERDWWLVDIKSTRRRNRFLQGNSCFCSAVNVVQGSPTEREFLQRYGSDVSRLASKGALDGFEGIDDIEQDSMGIREEVMDECTADQDCLDQDEGSRCVAGECLRDGTPRFQLTWTGDDDLDLRVTTPLGVTISSDNEYDPVSRGIFDTRFVQSSFRSHVESIFFQEGGTAPAGDYVIDVDVFEQRNSLDTWTLQVFSAGTMEQTFTGTGSQFGIVYSFSEGTLPTDCVLDGDETECCDDADCVFFGFGDVCAARTCIQNGAPRFTLTYYGDDDYDLFVITPDDVTISPFDQFDNITNGTFQQDFNEGNLGFHAENVYFPYNGTDSEFDLLAPNGEYNFFVEVYEQVGSALDAWTVEVYDPITDFTEIYSGAGRSDVFSFFKIPDIDGFRSEETECFIQEDIYCCSDEDCTFESRGDICTEFRCIHVGSIRFTLVWFGDDDLDLYVITPDGFRIDWREPIDEMTGGFLEDDEFPESVVVHVESVFFPEGMSPPAGTFQYGVGLWDRRGDSRDEWELRVFVDEEEVASRTGTGTSQVFNYEVASLPTRSPVSRLGPLREEGLLNQYRDSGV